MTSDVPALLLRGRERRERRFDPRLAAVGRVG